jgi:phage-related holin
MALIGVLLIDGIFGIIAGIKREGFKTYKALKVLKTIIVWIILLTLILSIEKAFPEISWLSETILVPFIIFELISILKNASMAGFIKKEVINSFLDKIDQHKGTRKK